MLAYYSLVKDRAKFITLYETMEQVDQKIELDPRIWLYIGDLAHSAGLNRIAVGSLFQSAIKSKE